MGLFDFFNVRRRLQQLVNKYNKAAYNLIGNSYTQYDQNQKEYVERGYNINPDVYSVINQMATKTANIPYYIKKIDDKNAKKSLDILHKATKHNFSPQQLIKSLRLEKKAFEEEIKTFPMERPNEVQTWYEILALYKTYIRLTGNAYFYILSPEDGVNKDVPIQLYLLPSHLVQIILKREADMLSVESPIDYYILTEGNTYIHFKAEDVMHVKLPNPNFSFNGDHLYGQSPLRAGFRNVQSSNLALDLNIKTMNNGGVYGFIHAKRAPLTEEQAASIKNRLNEMEASSAKLSNIAGSSAELAFTRLTLDSDELKVFDYLKYDQKQICNVLGWDDKFLNNDDGAKYDNINIIRRKAITDNILPDLKLLSDTFNNYFLPRFKGYEDCIWFFDVSELPEMQQDMELLSKWVYGAVDRGIITRDEARMLMKFIELSLPETEVLTVSTQTMTLEDSLIPGGDLTLNE